MLVRTFWLYNSSKGTVYEFKDKPGNRELRYPGRYCESSFPEKDLEEVAGISVERKELVSVRLIPISRQKT